MHVFSSSFITLPSYSFHPLKFSLIMAEDLCINIKANGEKFYLDQTLPDLNAEFVSNELKHF
jgi:hypothetical protein